MKGIQLLTDKEHFMTRLEVFPSIRVSRANSLFIDANAIHKFNGFGVAITGSSCYNLSIMKNEERRTLLKKIYSEEGLGLNIGRLSVGASDYSAEIYSYDDVPFDTELKYFSIVRDQKYIIPMIKEILEINPELYLFASPWSPPGWMKTGGNMCGGYMREEFLDCYAEYIVKFIKAYAQNGIKISALTPQNEPNTEQAGFMTACIMISKAIKCGYSSFTGWNLMLNEMGGPNIGPFLCGGLVTRNNDTTELSHSGQFIAFSHISPYINRNSKIYPVFGAEEYNICMSEYPTVNREIEGFCIDNNDGKYVLVLINPNDKKRQVQFQLDESWLYAELTPESISTIIIEK